MEATIYQIIRALDNDFRLLILDKLNGTAMTEKELFEKLRVERPDLKYRESLYRQIETLVAVGLVKKFYDVNKRRISYTSDTSKIHIDLRAMAANIIDDGGHKVVSQ